MVINGILGKKLIVRASRAMSKSEATCVAMNVDNMVSLQVQKEAAHLKLSSLTIYLVKKNGKSGSILVKGMHRVKDVVTQCLEAVGKWSKPSNYEITTKLTH